MYTVLDDKQTENKNSDISAKRKEEEHTYILKR